MYILRKFKSTSNKKQMHHPFHKMLKWIFPPNLSKPTTIYSQTFKICWLNSSSNNIPSFRFAWHLPLRCLTASHLQLLRCHSVELPSGIHTERKTLGPNWVVELNHKLSHMEKICKSEILEDFGPK